MPLVDYRCNGCGATHEVFASSPVADSIDCPDCGANARRRFGLGGLLGVRPARKAKDLLDRERATREPLDATGRQRLHEHLRGHDHHHDHTHDGHHHSHDDHEGHEHHHAHDHDAPGKGSSP